MKKPTTDSKDELKAWMQELAALPVAGSALPDPALLWWKAELLRRWDAQRRTAAPIEAGERVQAGVGLVGALTLLIYLFKTGLPPSLIIIMILSVLMLLVFAAITLRHMIAGD